MSMVSLNRVVSQVNVFRYMFNVHIYVSIKNERLRIDLFGDYDEVMNAVTHEIKRSHQEFGKAIFGEVLDKVLKETSTKALEENKIKPSGQPKIDLKSHGENKDLEYVISITELPKVGKISSDTPKSTFLLNGESPTHGS